MPPPRLDDLTLPREGSPSLRALLNEVWRKQVRDVLSFALPPEDAASGALHRQVQELLRARLAVDPAGVVRMLRRPMYSGLFAAAHRQQRTDRAAAARHLRELDLLLLVEFVASGIVPEVTVARGAWPWPRLVSPAANAIVQLPAEARVTLLPSLWAEAERPFHPLAGGVRFATADSNPLLSVQGHPDRPGNAVDLGGHAPAEWCRALDEALSLVAQALPRTWDEMRLLLEVLVPTGFDAERHVSVSYESSVGAIYLSLHSSALVLAEALVHEFQHNKLHAALQLDQLLLDAREPRHVSPVRPDLRPLHGVFLALHAYLAVARLYVELERQGHPVTRSHDFERRLRRIFQQNEEAAEVLFTHARPTPMGLPVIEELRALQQADEAYVRGRWG